MFSAGMRVWMNRWASACRHVNQRPQQLHQPHFVLGRLLADVWQSLLFPSPHSSPNTVVHEYGWQTVLPGLINVPPAHINHITIKPSRRQTILLNHSGLGLVSSSAGLIRSCVVCSRVVVLTASHISCDKAGCRCMLRCPEY